jgi:hypothetical protein
VVVLAETTIDVLPPSLEAAGAAGLVQDISGDVARKQRWIKWVHELEIDNLYYERGFGRHAIGVHLLDSVYQHIISRLDTFGGTAN